MLLEHGGVIVVHSQESRVPLKDSQEPRPKTVDDRMTAFLVAVLIGTSYRYRRTTTVREVRVKQEFRTPYVFCVIKHELIYDIYIYKLYKLGMHTVPLASQQCVQQF